MRVTKVRSAEEGELPSTGYLVTLDDGSEYTLDKEFYAHGPSLYSWMLRGEGTELEFSRKRDALGYLSVTPSGLGGRSGSSPGRP